MARLRFSFLFIFLVFSRVWAAAPFIGSIPVQRVTSGEDVRIDMHRFYEPSDGSRLVVEPNADYAVSFKPSSFMLQIRVSPERAGVIDVPLKVVTADGHEISAVLTLAAGRRHHQRFVYRPTTRPNKAVVAGSFNGWNQDKTPLLDPDGDGVYEAEGSFDPGTHTYKFVVDGKWISDPENPNKLEDGFGGFNSILRIEGSAGGRPPSLFADRIEGSPAARARIKCTLGDTELKDVSVVVENSDAGMSGPMGSSRTMKYTTVEGDILIDLAGIPADAWIRVVASDARGGVSNTVRFRSTSNANFSWENGIIYFAFTDRFSDGDTSNDRPIKSDSVLWPANFHGGDLRGIRNKIAEGYFDSLGVNVLWLSPFNRNPDTAYREYLPPYRYYTGYHGYWPVSPTEVDPHFGDHAELKALVNEAHRHGIRVIADLVVNHVHEAHPFWKQHPEWFSPLVLPDGTKNLRQWDAHSYTTWFDEFLPDIDFSQDAPTKAILENSEWWVKEFNLDGFRLDAVKHVPPDLWRKFRSHLRSTITDRNDSGLSRHLYLVGETFLDRQGIMSFVGPNMLDGQFDFPLFDTLKSVFADEGASFSDLEASLTGSEQVYGKESLMSTLVGNHDKSRFMAFADGDLPDSTEHDEEEVGWLRPPRVDNPSRYDRLRLAMAFLMTIDGVPMIYYGDEFGMSGAGDPDNRRDMRFGDDLSAPEKSVLKYCSALTKIRSAHPALRLGNRRALLVESDRYAYVRAHFDDRVLVALNRKSEPSEFTLDVAPELADGSYVNLLGGNQVTVTGGKLSMKLNGHSAAILVNFDKATPGVVADIAAPVVEAAPAPAIAPAYKSVGMAGTLNNWNTSDPTLQLTPPNDKWTLTRLFARGNYSFKFVINGGWDIHRGLGNDSKLEQPGRDIPLEVPRTGFYKVSLDLVNNTWSFEPAAPPQAIADVAVEPYYLLGLPISLDASPSLAGPKGTIKTYTWTEATDDAFKLPGLPSSNASPTITLHPDHAGIYKLTLSVNDGAPGIDREIRLIVKESFQLKTIERLVNMDLTAGKTYRALIPVSKGKEVDFQILKNFDDAPSHAFGPQAHQSIGTNQTSRIALSNSGQSLSIIPDQTGVVEIAYDPATREILVRKSDVTHFIFNPMESSALPTGTVVTDVAVAGTFNGWTPTKHPMHKNADGTFDLYAELPPGLYQYKVVVNGKHWIRDPSADSELNHDDNYGGINSGIMVGEVGANYGPAVSGQIATAALKHDPNEREYFNAFSASMADVRIRTLADDVTGVKILVNQMFDGGHTYGYMNLDSPRSHLYSGELPLSKLYSRFGFDYYGAYLPIDDRPFLDIDYAFEITKNDTHVFYSNHDHITASLLDSSTWWFAADLRVTFPTPDWAKNVVWYQIMLDRWRNGDPDNDPDNTVPWGWDWYKPFSDGEKTSFYGGNGIWNRNYGGDLRGLIDSLDYLKSLGVTGVYLNPMFEAPSHHKYNTADYRHIDDNFGIRGDVVEAQKTETADSRTWHMTPTDSLFLTFIKEAHSRGFKVILDGVFNHSGTEFWAFKDIVRDTMYSPYKDWYVIKDWNVVPSSPGGPTFSYEGWAGFAGLPEYAENDQGLLPGIRDHIFDITRRWMDPNGDGDPSDGIDGWRLDVAENVNERFWAQWRRVVKGVNPDAYITAEIWENAANRLQGEHHDAVMNYEFLKRVYGFFLPGGKTKAMTASEFAKAMQELESWYFPQVNQVLQNLLDSHDMDRIASAIHNRAGWKRGRVQDDNPSYDTGPPSQVDYNVLKQIVTFQMTWLGAPMVYYGDEVGMYGADDPTNRMPMWWGDHTPYENSSYKLHDDVFQHYIQMIALRNGFSALRTGRTKILLADDTTSVLAFERSDAAGRVIVVVNGGGKPANVTVPTTGQFVNVADPANIAYEDGVVSGIGARRMLAKICDGASRIAVENGGLAITVPARGCAIFAETR